MTTAYSYDNRNRLTKIEHKDGAAIKQSFLYALDDVGNITKTTQDDGSVWEYLMSTDTGRSLRCRKWSTF